MISHLSILSGENLPSVSQSVIRSGPQVVADSAEAVGSGRASTCASTLIPHAGGDLLWAGRSSAVAENVFFYYYYCTCICAHFYTCLCPFTTHVNAQIRLRDACPYIISSRDTNKTFFLQHTAIKSKTVLAWRDSKHVSWKIYGILELNCEGLLLEKDRWGLSRDMFYQFHFRCTFSFWRNATCIFIVIPHLI